MNSPLSHIDCGPAEPVLFKLVTNFCAHSCSLEWKNSEDLVYQREIESVKEAGFKVSKVSKCPKGLRVRNFETSETLKRPISRLLPGFLVPASLGTRCSGG